MYLLERQTPISARPAGFVAEVPGIAGFVPSSRLHVDLTGNPQKPANLFAPKCQRKRSRIKQIGWFLRVYPVQSVHAPHSEEVNAARASRLAG
jgi:hypothetical protein